jgi:hypothetical protein
VCTLNPLKGRPGCPVLHPITPALRPAHAAARVQLLVTPLPSSSSLEAPDQPQSWGPAAPQPVMGNAGEGGDEAGQGYLASYLLLTHMPWQSGLAVWSAT